MTDYEVLGISQNATDDEIYSAYRKKMTVESDVARIELAYKRLISIRPNIPCPYIKRQDIIYAVKNKAER